jgi:hypothetical protein
MEGTLNVDKFQLSIEGHVVVDLDKNNDGNALGLNGNELRRIMYGQTKLEHAIVNALQDVQIGFNGKLNMEVGLKSGGAAVTIPIGEATAFWNGHSIAVAAGSLNPYSGTFLEKLPLGNASMEGDLILHDNRDFRMRLQARNNFGFFGTELGNFELDIRKQGSNVEAEVSGRVVGLPLLNVGGTLRGRVRSNGAYDFSGTIFAGRDLGPIAFTGNVSLRLTNDTSGTFGSNPRELDTLLTVESNFKGRFVLVGIDLFAKIRLHLHPARFRDSDGHFRFNLSPGPDFTAYLDFEHNRLRLRVNVSALPTITIHI